jgi:hypothetical protein
MDTYVHCALMNYERGGLTEPVDTGLICGRGHWDLTGLRDSFTGMPFAPDLIVICEAKEWEMWGGQGLRAAARVLGAVFDRPYVPEMGWLPHGKSAPALFYDPTRLHLDYWGNNDLTVHADKRNLARVRLRHLPQLQFDVLVDHLPFWSGAARLDRAKLVAKLAQSRRKLLWLGDFNAPVSGPHWPQLDWSVSHPVDAYERAHLLPDGTFAADNEAMDYLLGRWVQAEYIKSRWVEGERVNGIGFHAIPELAWRQGMPADKALLPTTNDNILAGGGLLIDFGVLNDAWAGGLVPDSFHIDVPPGTTRADYPSDHRRTGWILDAAE